MHHFASLAHLPTVERAALLRGTPIRLLGVGISSPPSTAYSSSLAEASYTGYAASALLGALGASASTWVLQISVSAVEARARTDGVGAHTIPLGETLPRACAAGEEQLLEIPGGLSIASEGLLSLRSVGSLSSAVSELGWLHVHTSFLEPEAVAHAPARPLDSPTGAPVHTALFRKADVDLVKLDSRFGPDWWFRLYYVVED